MGVEVRGAVSARLVVGDDFIYQWPWVCEVGYLGRVERAVCINLDLFYVLLEASVFR